MRMYIERLETRRVLTSIAEGDFTPWVVGAPLDDVEGVENAGSAFLSDGTILNLGLPDAAADLGARDKYGAVLEWGDFNGDGRTDLAIGIPDRDVDGMVNAGAVHIVYRSVEGFQLTTDGDSPDDQFWHLNSPGMSGQADVEDRFGAALAAGDFNNDGYDDLAIGVPHDDVGEIVDAGIVTVLYGGPDGLDPGDENGTPCQQEWHQDVRKVKGQAEAGDRFGAGLAAGDYNGDGFWDLAIGGPGDENFFDIAGSVNIIFGNEVGLIQNAVGTTPEDQVFIDYDYESVPSSLGEVLESGDFNGDGVDDLAIGAPDQEVYGVGRGAGQVYVLYGAVETGFTPLCNLRCHQLWIQSGPLEQSSWFYFPPSQTTELEAQKNAGFGSSLASGDFNSDGVDDLAIGSPFYDVLADDGGVIQDAGAVNVLYGHPESGLRARARGTTPDDQAWHLDVRAVQSNAVAGDRFGASLSVGQRRDATHPYLIVGIPYKDMSAAYGLPAQDNVGAATIFSGTEDGLVADDPNDEYLRLDYVFGDAREGDTFGASVL